MVKYGIVLCGNNRNILAGKGMAKRHAERKADKMRQANFLQIIKVMPENKAEALCQPKLI